MDAGESGTLNLLKATSSTEGAMKYLWGLWDGAKIESVILQHENMICACVSSQVGCPLDCIFCATGRIGLARNLSVSEIVGQALRLRREAERLEWTTRAIDRVLFMGMGEPLFNYESVVRSAILIHEGAIIGSPEVHLATSGKLYERIRELARDAPFVRLWISLCASNELLRSRLMPKASSTSIEVLLNTGEAFAGSTGYPVRIDYLMIDGLTDGFREAEDLVQLLRGRPFELQLSRLNPIALSALKGSPSNVILRFAEMTSSGGLPTTIFESKGTDALAACGQLSAPGLEREV